MSIGLLTTEIVLRIWTAIANPALYVLDAQLGWKHAARINRRVDTDGTGSVRFATDGRGLRATRHGNARTPGKRRVLFAGDSFTQGSQVEEPELFTARLERSLERVECFNAGVGGYSTLQELRAMRPQLAKYSPDLVVLVVYENDFQDNLMPYYCFLGPRPYVRVRGQQVEVVDDPDPAPFERFLMPAPCALWCYEHCALYRMVHKNVFWQLRGLELVELEQRERADLREVDERIAMAWLLQQVQATVQAARAKLLVAAIPVREDARAGSALSHQWLAETCDRLGVPFVSTLQALHDAGVDRVYLPKDIHLTARGHECIAQALQAPIAAALAGGK